MLSYLRRRSPRPRPAMCACLCTLELLSCIFVLVCYGLFGIVTGVLEESESREGGGDAEKKQGRVVPAIVQEDGRCPQTVHFDER